MKATMSYLYGYVSNSGNFWIYPHKRHCPKAYEAQDHSSYVWSIPNSKEIKSINKLFLTTLLNHLLYGDCYFKLFLSHFEFYLCYLKPCYHVLF